MNQDDLGGRNDLLRELDRGEPLEARIRAALDEAGDHLDLFAAGNSPLLDEDIQPLWFRAPLLREALAAIGLRSQSQDPLKIYYGYYRAWILPESEEEYATALQEYEIELVSKVRPDWTVGIPIADQATGDLPDALHRGCLRVSALLQQKQISVLVEVNSAPVGFYFVPVSAELPFSARLDPKGPLAEPQLNPCWTFEVVSAKPRPITDWVPFREQLTRELEGGRLRSASGLGLKAMQLSGYPEMPLHRARPGPITGFTIGVRWPAHQGSGIGSCNVLIGAHEAYDEEFWNNYIELLREGGLVVTPAAADRTFRVEIPE